MGAQPGGLRSIGHSGTGFAFDNEGPPHREYLEPYQLASRLVSACEYAGFVDDGGYQRAELWLSDGFAAAQAGGWTAPLYWERRGDRFWRFTLHGELPVDAAAPVTQVSYYEADAYRTVGRSAPAYRGGVGGGCATSSTGRRTIRGGRGPGGSGIRRVGSPLRRAWVWTSSPYVAYPGFRPASGAVGEYNGRFMVNQLVLRGGSCLTPRGHLRATYRNFFPPSARWQLTGIRLAR